MTKMIDFRSALSTKLHVFITAHYKLIGAQRQYSTLANKHTGFATLHVVGELKG